MNWATRQESPLRFADPENNAAPVPQLKIRRRPRGEGRMARNTGFRHAGRNVEVGEIIECDHDIAATLVQMGKAELVDGKN